MLPRLLLDTKNCQQWAKTAKKALAEGRCPPQELEVDQRSGPYLLVFTHDSFSPVIQNVTHNFKVLLSLKISHIS